jgi:hypothetical protein
VHEKTAQLLLHKETLEEDDIAALRAQIAPAETTGGTTTNRLPHPPVA